MAIRTYQTGAASVLASGTTVTGTGVIWSGGNAREGDEFVIDGVRALILEVVSATELTITPWQGGNESGAAYTIYQTSSRRFEDVQIADDLQKQVAALNTDGFYHFVKSSEAAPDPSLGDEGQYAFQATTGKLWLKEGGVWVYVGVFKGVSPKGPWDSATDYAANDLVSHGGSSYLAVAASTNDAPPSANWMLIAEKGEPGQDGTNGADGAQGPIGPIGLVNAGVYNPATAYEPTDYVIDNGSTWVCVAATTGNAPPVLPVESNTWWSLLARKGQDGTGTGDMQAANNLSDLVDPDAALDNLGGTSVGKAVFTAVDQAAARAAIGGGSNLPVIIASDHGVIGDGSDQTVALQNLIDETIPADGGVVVLGGDISFTTLDLSGRHNITFVGNSGDGTGAAQPTELRCTSGAIGNGVPAINLKATNNVSFHNLYISASSASFDGVLLMYGDPSPIPGDDARFMSLNNCLLHSNGTSNARLLWLYGATQGTFERVSFSGSARHVQMQEVAGVGFCNVHQFRECSFRPTSSNPVVIGSGEAISFLNCTIQASTGDGKGRFWSTSSAQDFRGISIIGCGLYDVTDPGEIWCNFYRGEGLVVIGNRLGGADPASGGNYGFNLGGYGTGVRGFCFIGNSAERMTSMLIFSGSVGDGTAATKGIVGANSVFSGSTVLYNSLASAGVVTNFPNYVAVDANARGSHFFIQGMPTSSSGLDSGDWWNNAGVPNIVA